MSFHIDYWVFQTLAMMVTAFILPGVRVTGFWGALIAVICLAFFNAHLWDAALFFKIPDTMTSQAILLIVMNGVLFWIFAKIIPGIEINGILPALAAPIVFTLLSIFISQNLTGFDWHGMWTKTVVTIRNLRYEFQFQPE